MPEMFFVNELPSLLDAKLTSSGRVFMLSAVSGVTTVSKREAGAFR